MDPEITSTLGELEQKLRELEQTLSAIGRADERSELVIDESDEASPPQPSGAAPPPAREDAAANAYAPGASSSPPAGTAGPPPAGTSFPPPDAAGEPRAAGRPWAGAGAEAPPAPQPATPAAFTPQGPPSEAELRRFRERLQRSAGELTREYDELIARLAQPARGAAASASAGPAISFARGAPSLDIVDVEGLREAAARALENDPGGATAYGTSVGYPRLRAWIAERHGVEVERVLVTNGSMQADAFLFEHTVRPGDEVVVERPTYDRTLLSLRQRGARLSAVELQSDGIDTDALAQLLGSRGARPRLAHVIPNFQNPAGHTLSLPKREALLELASRYGFVVFEDDPYVALRFSGESLPTMLSLDPRNVVYASSFSKTVCPGIRVGYLVGPADVIEAIAALATNTYISPSMVAQSIVYEFCASGAIERSIETVRAALAERAQVLTEALRRELPEARYVAPEGGYFLWVTLPPGTDVARLHRTAGEAGVQFVKGTDFMLEGGENTLRLAYSGVTPAQIEEGVRRLAAAYRAL